MNQEAKDIVAMYAINSNQDAVMHYGILIRINGIHSKMP